MTKEFPPALVGPLTQLKPESICEAELTNLALEIKTAQATLVKTMKAVHETKGIWLARATASDLLRQKMEEFESKNGLLSLKKDILMDQKKQLQQQLTELTEQKNQLERELDKLKETPAKKKTKRQPSGNSLLSSSAVSLEIQQKEASLSNVKAKLLVFVEEEKDSIARIEALEKKLAENAVILSQMRTEQDSLNDGSADAAGLAKLRALKKDQRSRIREFSRLEKKLFDLSCGHVLNELRRKEEEWINALGFSDEDEE